MFTQHKISIQTILYLSVLISLVTSDPLVTVSTISDCAQNISEPNVPLLRLGGVALSRECESVLTPLLHNCHREYFEATRTAYLAAKCYAGSESFRRALCCRLWDAKDCFIQAASSRLECEGNTTDLYRALPSAKEEREHVLDQCSEYGEGVASCETELHATFSFGAFVAILLAFISLPVIVFGIMKAHEFYQEYKKFKQEEAENHNNQGHVIRLDTVDHGKVSLPLTEKGEYHDDEWEEEEKLTKKELD